MRVINHISAHMDKAVAYASGVLTSLERDGKPGRSYMKISERNSCRITKITNRIRLIDQLLDNPERCSCETLTRSLMKVKWYKDEVLEAGAMRRVSPLNVNTCGGHHPTIVRNKLPGLHVKLF